MQSVKTFLIILISVTLLGACGHKGPLYLPEEKSATEKKASADADADKEKKNQDKDSSIPGQ